MPNRPPTTVQLYVNTFKAGICNLSKIGQTLLYCMDIQILIPEEKICRRVTELGKKIAADHRERDLYVVAILHGAMVFAADLIRQIDLPLTLDIMFAASYDGMNSGELKYLTGPNNSLHERDVLIIDDILDTGQTLAAAVRHFRERGARSVKTCVLLEKPARRNHDIRADYFGFRIENEFVVGYGLDLDGRYRNLPAIAKPIPKGRK